MTAGISFDLDLALPLPQGGAEGGLHSVPSAQSKGTETGRLVTWRRIFIGAGVLVGVLCAVLAFFVAFGGVAPGGTVGGVP